MQTKITFLHVAFLVSFITTQAQWTQLGQDINGANTFDQCGSSVGLNSNGSIMATGSIANDNNGVNAGRVRIYQNTEGNWIQIGEDIGGKNEGDRAGWAISLNSDGSIVAIGAVNHNENTVGVGYVSVYQNIGGTWNQIGQDIEGESSINLFGFSISLSSDGLVLAIGSPQNSENGSDAGLVKIYNYIGGTWTQIGSNIAGENSGDSFGESVSLSSDGSTVAIGAPNNNGNGTQSGHVQIFHNTSGTWTQIGSDIEGEAAGDLSGHAVSINPDGSMVAIGAYKNSGNGTNAGHVRIYQNVEGNWEQIGEDIDGEPGDFSGFSVSLNSNFVAIGAYLNSANGTESGLVRIYKNSNGTWTQVDQDIEGAAGDLCGLSVKLSSSGSIVAIGSPGNSENGDFSGQARVFENQSLVGIPVLSKREINIYPNPTRGIVYFDFNNKNSVKIFIYNATGKLISNSQLSMSKNQIKIDLSDFENGIYMIELQTDNEILTAHIVKE